MADLTDGEYGDQPPFLELSKDKKRVVTAVQ